MAVGNGRLAIIYKMTEMKLGGRLIDYTKWVIKWPLVVAAVVAVMIGGSVRTAQWWLDKF